MEVYKFVTNTGSALVSLLVPDEPWALEYRENEWTKSGLGPIMCFATDNEPMYGDEDWRVRLERWATSNFNSWGYHTKYSFELWLADAEDTAPINWMLALYFFKRAEVIYHPAFWDEKELKQFWAGEYSREEKNWGLRVVLPPDGTIGAGRVRLKELLWTSTRHSQI